MKTKKFLAILMACVGVLFCAQVACAERPVVLTQLIEGLQVGEPVHYEGLTIIPIYSINQQKKVSFVTLEEALSKKYLTITETDGGRVPQVRVSNNSDHYVYLMGGEILTGCKQDRIVGRDTLIGPQSKNVLVTVYCVEQGRWTHQSAQFYSKGNLGLNSLRAEAQYEPYYDSSKQHAIWEGVSSNNSRLQVRTSTGAYQAAYEDHEVKSKLSSYEKRLSNIPTLYNDTIGVVIGIGNKIVSADIFADAVTFSKIWPKLLKASAVEAMSANAQGVLTQNDASRFLKILYAKHYTRKAGADAGVEFSVVDKEVNVNALTLGNTVIHVAAFPQENAEKVYNDPQQYNNEMQERRVRVMGND